MVGTPEHPFPRRRGLLAGQFVSRKRHDSAV
jgi:hypothetical protein